MRIVDLKKEYTYLTQYVGLRNKYADLLITQPVDMEGTRQWLLDADIEIRGLVEDETLQGVLILYLARNNEIAFFVKEPNKGWGAQLLDLAESIAREKSLDSLWAWAWEKNTIAQRVFEKKGFIKESIEKREYRGAIRKGFKYVKTCEPPKIRKPG